MQLATHLHTQNGKHGATTGRLQLAAEFAEQARGPPGWAPLVAHLLQHCVPVAALQHSRAHNHHWPLRALELLQEIAAGAAGCGDGGERRRSAVATGRVHAGGSPAAAG